MSGLVRCLLFEGWSVSGSDRSDSPIVESLRTDGVAVFIGHRAENVPSYTQLIVHSAAIGEDNPERQEAARRGITQRKYAEMLGNLMGLKFGVAIAGAHGKTTTTGMAAYAMVEAGLRPNFIIGGDIPQLGGNARGSNSDLILVEACEYDRSFLNLTPEIAVITNIDEDHLDYYSGIDEIEDAFLAFTQKVRQGGMLIGCAEDERVRNVLSRSGQEHWTYGFGGADWVARNITVEQGVWHYDVSGPSGDLGRYAIGIPGEHNILNSLPIIAIGEYLGLSAEAVKGAIREYRGAARRFHYRGEVNGITVIDDYAHHPTEVRAVLAAARNRYPDRPIWCVFQPHQFSRTRVMLDDFAESFDGADRVLLPEIYFARDSEEDRSAVSSRDLADRIERRGGVAEFHREFDQICARVLATAEPGTILLTMGAGNVWQVAESLVAPWEAA
jgi:UDP-N-acetylmuramate--alanine ligase